MYITYHLKRLGKSDKEINAILNAVEANPNAKSADAGASANNPATVQYDKDGKRIKS